MRQQFINEMGIGSGVVSPGCRIPKIIKTGRFFTGLSKK